MDQGSLGRRVGRWQNLRSRSRRHEVRHLGVDLDLHLYSRIKNRLKGRLTLTAVSDEETFGPYGARYLMEHHPEVHGDALLNGEPSSPLTIRFGEKGPLWLRFTVRTPGAHGAYTHLTPSATKIAARMILDLEE